MTLFLLIPFKANLWLQVLELLSRLTVLAVTGQIVVEIPGVTSFRTGRPPAAGR